MRIFQCPKNHVIFYEKIGLYKQSIFKSQMRRGRVSGGVSISRWYAMHINKVINWCKVWSADGLYIVCGQISDKINIFHACCFCGGFVYTWESDLLIST